MEKTEKVRLELPLVLPEVDDPSDPCIERLVGLLKGRPGLEHVHMKTPEGELPSLCLHYDPAIMSVARLRELVTAVGAQLTEKYAHYVGMAPGPLHPRGARTFAERLRRVPGVLEAEVSGAGRIRIEYERSAVPRAQLERLVRSFGAELSNGDAPANVSRPAGGHAHEHMDHKHGDKCSDLHLKPARPAFQPILGQE